MTYKSLLPLPLDSIEPLPEPEPELQLLDLEILIDHRVSRGKNGCLLWQGGFNQRGLPQTKISRYENRSVQRIQYRRHHGPVPAGLVIGTSCGLKSCLEPSHLLARKKVWKKNLWPNVPRGTMPVLDPVDPEAADPGLRALSRIVDKR